MVKLVCYNIEYCEGMTGHWYEYLKFWRTFNPPKNIDQKIVSELKKLKLDILALIEVDTGSIRAKKDEVKYFSNGLRLRNFVEKVKYPITSWLSMYHHVPILKNQANALMSKYKLENIKYHVFHEGTKRMIIETTVKCPKPITLLVAHLALGGGTRRMQINELIGIVSKIKNPVILMGDFNTFRGEEEIKKLLKETHLTDKHWMTNPATTLTQPSYHPKKRLDYILTSDNITVKKYKALDYDFSDHKPLYVEFSLKK